MRISKFSPSSFRFIRFLSQNNTGKLNHVAIATNNLENHIKLYKDILGLKVSDVMPQKLHGVYTVFVELGDTKIELLSPFGEGSPIKKFVDGNPSGGGIHHICIEVVDISKTIVEMRRNNIRLLSEGTKIGAHGKPVVFAHPKDCGGVLIEFEQK